MDRSTGDEWLSSEESEASSKTSSSGYCVAPSSMTSFTTISVSRCSSIEIFGLGAGDTDAAEVTADRFKLCTSPPAGPSPSSASPLPGPGDGDFRFLGRPVAAV